MSVAESMAVEGKGLGAEAAPECVCCICKPFLQACCLKRVMHWLSISGQIMADLPTPGVTVAVPLERFYSSEITPHSKNGLRVLMIALYIHHRTPTVLTCLFLISIHRRWHCDRMNLGAGPSSSRNG